MTSLTTFPGEPITKELSGISLFSVIRAFAPIMQFFPILALFKITAPIAEGCPPIVQNEIYIPISPVPSEIWFPIEFLFDAGNLGPLGF